MCLIVPAEYCITPSKERLSSSNEPEAEEEEAKEEEVEVEVPEKPETAAKMKRTITRQRNLETEESVEGKGSEMVPVEN